MYGNVGTGLYHRLSVRTFINTVLPSHVNPIGNFHGYFITLDSGSGEASVSEGRVSTDTDIRVGVGTCFGSAIR